MLFCNSKFRSYDTSTLYKNDTVYRYKIKFINFPTSCHILRKKYLHFIYNSR